MASEPVLNYAHPELRTPRYCVRPAKLSLIWAVLTSSPLTVAPTIVAVERGWISVHFFCCQHPQLALLIFVVLPAIGAVLGAIALVRIMLRPTERRGLRWALPAMLLGIASAFIGYFFTQLLKV